MPFDPVSLVFYVSNSDSRQYRAALIARSHGFRSAWSRSGGHADGHHSRCDVSGDHCTGSYQRAPTDGHARDNGYPRPQFDLVL